MNLPVKGLGKSLNLALIKELPPYFTKPEIDQILSNLWKKQKLRDYLLVLLLWQTGARISELLNVKIEDIDFYNSLVKLFYFEEKG